MNKDLKMIKKKYGEEMAHFCRSEFSTILEEEGLLTKIFLNSFYPSHDLYSDILKNNKIDDFKEYIYSLIENDKKGLISRGKSPAELLAEAGYNLYACKTEEQVQSFKKYYAKGEALCTFNGGRLNRCHVFFAVKKNVDEIKRENFKEPKRQDEYGTSVISIQFSKENNYLSIKNRYNHTVNNPDATFSNNLDNIIEGLTYSFEAYYGLAQCNQKSMFEIPNYVLASDGKYYKYNKEINNYYYCPNNIIIDNFKIKSYPKERFIVCDYFILDLKRKKIRLFDKTLDDSFINGLKNIVNIEVEKEENNKFLHINTNDDEVIEIELDKDNNIISYKNNNLIKVDKNFMYYSTKLKKLECSNLKIIGDCFLYCNNTIKELDLENVFYIGNNFLYNNNFLQNINLPNVIFIKNRFLENNQMLKELDLPKTRLIGSNFIKNNKILSVIKLPQVEVIGSSFLYMNNQLDKFNLPSLKIIGSRFLYRNKNLKSIKLPKLQQLGVKFMYNNKYVNRPNIKATENDFSNLEQYLNSEESQYILSLKM